MPPRLSLIIIPWIASMAALFIFSSNSNPNLKQNQEANLTKQTTATIKTVPVSETKKEIQKTAPKSIPPVSATSQFLPPPTEAPKTTSPIPATTTTTASIPEFPTSTNTSSTTTTAPTQTAASPPDGQNSGRHIFYTSSHWKAKYYYCDSDNGWQNLSQTYLKSFSSENELLSNYPGRILHEPCK